MAVSDRDRFDAYRAKHRAKAETLFTPEEVEFLESYNYPSAMLPQPDREHTVQLWGIMHRLTAEHGVLAQVFFAQLRRTNDCCSVCGGYRDPACITGC